MTEAQVQAACGEGRAQGMRIMAHAHSPESARMAILAGCHTIEHGAYLTDGSLAHVVRFTVVDPGYSVDLGRFAGAAFLDSQTVMALAENKSYVVLRVSDRAGEGGNYRYFLESFDAFDQVRRSRFSTVRARMMYTMSVACDPATKSIYTVTVPNSKVRQLVVSRFDQRDWTLSEEFLPALAPDAGLAFRGEKRSLDELYITGATIAAGRMYAISAAYDTLLTIDLSTRAVVAAHTIAGLSRPTGIAARGNALYVVSADGTVTVVERPVAP